jgi:hypothetical protein
MLRDPKAAMRDSLNDAEPVKGEPPRSLMRELQPADPFPVQALGDVLAPAARAIHDRVQAPIAMCGQSVLAAATLAVQGHADVELPTAQARPIANYFVSVAATGERKSAVDREALSPVRKREASLGESYDGERLNYENAKEAWDGARKAAIKAGKKDRGLIKEGLDMIGPPPSPPLRPIMTCTEPTYEGLCRLLLDSLPSVGIFAAEGGQFIGGHGMADDARLRTAAGLSALWDGETIKRVRALDGVTILPGRRLTLHLMAQPDVASIWFNDRLLVEQGLMSRVLVTAPQPASGTRMWHEASPLSDRDAKRYYARLLEILERPLPLADGKRNELAPRALRLSAGARGVWIRFHDHIEARIGRGGELEPVRGLGNKLAEHAARIAAVLMRVNDVNAVEITRLEMERGIALAEHYACEASRLFGASRVRADLHLAQRLLDWLLTTWREPSVSLPDIYQRGLNAIGDQATARRLVGILEGHGWLIRIQDGAVVGGVRRREAWRIVGEVAL